MWFWWKVQNRNKTSWDWPIAQFISFRNDYTTVYIITTYTQRCFTMNSCSYIAPNHSFIAGDIIRLPIEHPPSSRIWAPVMCTEAEEERNNMFPARSCGTPTRPSKLSAYVFDLQWKKLPVSCLAVILSPFWAKPNAVMRDGKTLWMGIVKPGWE